MTFNQGVLGSSPSGLTFSKSLQSLIGGFLFFGAIWWFCFQKDLTGLLLSAPRDLLGLGIRFEKDLTGLPLSAPRDLLGLGIRFEKDLTGLLLSAPQDLLGLGLRFEKDLTGLPLSAPVRPVRSGDPF